jgi:hypothetical protein
MSNRQRTARSAEKARPGAPEEARAATKVKLRPGKPNPASASTAPSSSGPTTDAKPAVAKVNSKGVAPKGADSKGAAPKGVVSKDGPAAEPSKPRPRRTAKPTRMKIVWEICSGTGEVVKTYPYAEKAAAEAELLRLSNIKREHVLRNTKVPMD